MRMRVEGAAGEADVGRALVAVALHPRRAAADHAHRQPAAQRLAVGDQVGLHAEVALRAARAEAEAHEHLVEDQRDAALGADLAQLAQPGGVGGLVVGRAARAVDQRAVARRRLVRMQRLQRIHQHAGDVAPGAQHLQAARVHVAQRVGALGRQRVAGTGLGFVPPAVVRAAEAHQVRLPRVIAGQPHRLHHRLRARHVEGQLVHARMREDAPHVVLDQRVVDAQHRAKRLHPPRAFCDAALVERVAEEVDAVAAGQVDEAFAVEVGEPVAVARDHHRPERQLALHQRAERRRHAVVAGELEVRQRGLHRLRRGDAARMAGLERARQRREAGASRRDDGVRRVVGVEEALVVEAPRRHQPRQPHGHPRMARQRRVLRPRELQPAPAGRRVVQGHEPGRGGGDRQQVEGEERRGHGHGPPEPRSAVTQHWQIAEICIRRN